MISRQAKSIREQQFQNRDLEYLLNTEISVQRKDWEISALNDKLPEGTEIEKFIVKDIDGELIKNQMSDSQHIILYFHGGGLTLGSCITHRKLVSYIAKITNIPVFVHNYPLAPEYPYPAALNNSLQVYLHLNEKGYKSDQILYGGDSSGCALALSLILKLKSNHFQLPKGVFLFSPMLDFTLSGETIKTLAEIDPCLFAEDIKMTANLYCNGECPENPFITPLNGSFGDFPPLLIQTGSCEMLLDDSMRLREKANGAGVDVCLEIWNEMWHVFQGQIGKMPEAEQALAHVNLFIKRILKI